VRYSRLQPPKYRQVLQRIYGRTARRLAGDQFGNMGALSVDPKARARRWLRWRHSGPVAGWTRTFDWLGLFHPSTRYGRLMVE
jgi:hypothetical protein